MRAPAWAAAVGRLAAICGLFYTVFSASPQFKAFVGEYFGLSPLNQVELILVFYFGGELLLSIVFQQQRVDRALAPIRARLTESVSQNKALAARASEAERQLPREVGAQDFEASLVVYIASLKAQHRQRNILRLHGALSRYLWVEGLLRARVALGEATEAAAASLGEQESQLGALIDDMGWTLVTQHDYDRATSKIEYGRHLAKTWGKIYWTAKAHRHLAGMYIIQKQYDEAVKLLGEAEQATQAIVDQQDKTDMLAGIEYARSVIELLRGAYDSAMSHIEASDRLRLKAGDETRIVRSFALRGKILLARRDPVSIGAAKEQFRLGLARATDIGRRDEIIRNHNGLARVAQLEGDSTVAERHRQSAKELSKDTPVPYEIEDDA